MRSPISIPTALIYPKSDGRAVIKAHVAMLAESLKALGLHTPITVRQAVRVRDGRDADAYEIVAGRHRYEAAVSLNWKEIDAVVMDGSADDAELWEIDENFARAELSDAQRADHHARREAILVRKGVVAPGTRGGKRQNVVCYSEQTADALGVDRRTVQRDLARGKKIDPAVLADIAGTDLDKGVVLDELARAPRESQAAKAAEIRERQDAEKLNRYADKAVARSSAEEAADIIHGALDLDQIDAVMARLASVTMKDFLAALSSKRAS
jgi:ParB-like chromosome segregation protein Spo0J